MVEFARRPGLSLAVAILATGAPAHADRWLTVEAPAASAVSDVQAHVFRAGAMPAIGVYTTQGVWALGLRGRFGVLRNGPAIADPSLMDPSTGGVGSATVALRLGAGGGWAELCGGVALTGSDVAPAIEGGVGYWFPTKHFDLGPSLRYMRLVSADAGAKLGSADVVLLGVELRFGRRAAPVPVVRAAPAVAAAPPPVEPERDADPLVDTEAPCSADTDGCAVVVSPDLPAMVDDRITLDDDVFFDFNRARVKSGGRRVVAAIAAAWHDHPDWRAITIEGHADVRGSDAYNLWLSQLRADRVKGVLVTHGFAAEQIQAIGYGRSRPRDPGHSEAAHQRNRRVEFVVDRGGTQ